VAIGNVELLVIASALRTLSGSVAVFVCCWLVAESFAWKLRLNPD
jgi:hypothetical protein